MNIIRKLISQQIELSKRFDKKFLPEKFLIDGNHDFLKNFLPNILQEISANPIVYDIGCGKKPAISIEAKKKLNAKVIGIDLSTNELLQAPSGSIDSCIEADICNYHGNEDGDLLLCQALLEHVPDTEAAFKSMSSLLHKDGIALIFVPCRNAIFARLNIILPQRIKQFLLYSIFPNSRRNQGFSSYYNRCTPRDFKLLASQYGFEFEEIRIYHRSYYFSFFFPLHFIWRLYLLIFEKINSEQSAESFSLKLRRI
jgi:2-polyprenyl-6-hydroxyphenyl methylase/3-demethylubiquinone-9 3-methyltransferase